MNNETSYIRLSEFVDALNADNERLLAENGRLRELVCMTAKALGIGSDWCSADCYATFNCDGETCPVADRMAELGIEVE